MKTASTTSQDSASNPTTRPANFTRQTSNLTRKFWRNGQWHLIPLYHLLRLSDFMREGIERSGSYLFADHMYRNEASGRGFLGRLIDRVALNLPATQAMRRRYVKATEALTMALIHRSGSLRVLALPCGLPRDVLDVVKRHPRFACRIDYIGMDLDEEVVQAARDFLKPIDLKSKRFLRGNALEISDYPTEPIDFAISTGLGEFLNDQQLRTFYQNVFDRLAPGGIFFTSATTREPRSDYLLRNFELHTQYRTFSEMERLFSELPWKQVSLEKDVSGLQTFIRAVR